MLSLQQTNTLSAHPRTMQQLQQQQYFMWHGVLTLPWLLAPGSWVMCVSVEIDRLGQTFEVTPDIRCHVLSEEGKRNTASCTYQQNAIYWTAISFVSQHEILLLVKIYSASFMFTSDSAWFDRRVLMFRMRMMLPSSGLYFLRPELFSWSEEMLWNPHVHFRVSKDHTAHTALSHITSQYHSF